VHLFAQRGYAATGIRDVARDAGITPAALYHHMGGKQDLLVHIMRDALHGLIESAHEALREATTPPERIASLAWTHVFYNGKHQLEALVTDGEIRSLDPQVRPSVVKLRDTYEALWAEAIHDGVESGDFHIADERMYRLSVIQMCNGVNYWYSPAGPAPLRVIADQHAEFALLMAGYRGELPQISEPRPEEVAEHE
jgi:AcrR family transcriptional regulator